MGGRPLRVELAHSTRRLEETRECVTALEAALEVGDATGAFEEEAQRRASTNL